MTCSVSRMSKILFCTHLLNTSLTVNSEYGFVAWDKCDILVCNAIYVVLGVYINYVNITTVVTNNV